MMADLFGRNIQSFDGQTEKSAKIYCQIAGQKAHGFLPSVRELCELTGLRSTSAVYAQLNSQ